MSTLKRERCYHGVIRYPIPREQVHENLDAYSPQDALAEFRERHPGALWIGVYLAEDHVWTEQSIPFCEWHK